MTLINLSGDIWQRWELRRQELAAKGTWKLAGLFRGHEGSRFRSATKRVLYTGKATAGPYEPNPEDNNFFGCNTGAFWSFARRLNRLTRGDPDELANIAWSNLCKIGTRYGNPDDVLVKAQADLAVETLRQEWIELKPTLVICVAENYQEHLIYAAFGVTQNHNDGFKEINVPGGKFWRRPALDGMPAFLWMKHPQGKLLEYLEAAEALAKEVISA